jgi:hypothetical protein
MSHNLMGLHGFYRDSVIFYLTSYAIISRSLRYPNDLILYLINPQNVAVVFLLTYSIKESSSPR